MAPSGAVRPHPDRADRSYVPFDGLWSMAIDVPYSYLLRDGDLAWTCGQLALDPDAAVLAPDDLAAQSVIVCDHVEAILQRASLRAEFVRRAYLYHVDTGADARSEMVETFRRRLGMQAELIPIAVPHFYYDGVHLEVDVFWAGPGAPLRFVRGPGGRHRLSEHGFISSPETEGPPIADPGAAVVVGADAGPIVGVDVAGPAVETQVRTEQQVRVVARRSGSLLWLQARSLDATAGLVSQTEALMARMGSTMRDLGVSFADVVKSTTHYAGDSSPSDLHDNMEIRNGYYRSPGPASTGIPVRGFADPASKIVVDVTLTTTG